MLVDMMAAIAHMDYEQRRERQPKVSKKTKPLVSTRADQWTPTCANA